VTVTVQVFAQPRNQQLLSSWLSRLLIIGSIIAVSEPVRVRVHPPQVDIGIVQAVTGGDIGPGIERIFLLSLFPGGCGHGTAAVGPQ
jgi:hypothetical protein